MWCITKEKHWLFCETSCKCCNGKACHSIYEPSWTKYSGLLTVLCCRKIYDEKGMDKTVSSQGGGAAQTNDLNRSTRKPSFSLGGWGELHKRPMFKETCSVTVSVIVQPLFFLRGVGSGRLDGCVHVVFFFFLPPLIIVLPIQVHHQQFGLHPSIPALSAKWIWQQFCVKPFGNEPGGRETVATLQDPLPPTLQAQGSTSTQLLGMLDNVSLCLDRHVACAYFKRSARTIVVPTIIY